MLILIIGSIPFKSNWDITVFSFPGIEVVCQGTSNKEGEEKSCDFHRIYSLIPNWKKMGIFITLNIL